LWNVIFINVYEFVERFQVGALLDGRAGLGAHEEPIKAVYAVRSMEGGKALAFVTYGYGPKGVQAVTL
jgi:hypothetical protein